MAELGDLSKSSAVIDRDRTHVIISLGNESFKLKIDNPHQPNQRAASNMSTATDQKALGKFRRPTLNNYALPQFGMEITKQPSVTPSAKKRPSFRPFNF